MHLRPIIPSDVPRCCTIVDSAFTSSANELYSFLAPNRSKYPHSWRSLVLKIQYDKYWNPNARGIVCVADEDDDFAPTGEILGVARWIRRASPEDAKAEGPVNPWVRERSLLGWTESWLRWAELRWETALRINPAKAWANEDAFMAVVMISSGFRPLRGKTHWWLDSLTVAPEYQRRGVARRLLEAGLERAQNESEERVRLGREPVPVALIATVDGLELYRGAGFRVMGWQDDSFLAAAADGGSVCVWDPSGYWVRAIEFEGKMGRGKVEGVYTSREDES